MRHWQFVLPVTMVAVVLASCAGPTASGSRPGEGSASRPQQEAGSPGKTLVVATRAEPPSLSPKPFRSLGLTSDLSGRMFNAGLVIRNDDGDPQPYLAQSVPQVNSDAWRVNPDGTMQTTYKLKPNLTWHDGQPLTADDFVFAFEVFSNPTFGVAGSPPVNFMAGVTAPSPDTIVVDWNRTFPYANELEAGSGGTGNNAFPPLPRHILGQPFQSTDPDAFMASTFWTTDYVGAGPYKLDRWETGAFLEGAAFDGHVLGKAKIPRIRELFIGDPNTVIANMLSGEAQLTAGDSIRFNDGEVLETQWGDRGTVIDAPNLYRMVQFQRRPEFASTMAFTDLRVRQALHYGVDFDSLNEAVQGGKTTAAIGPIPPTATYYRQLDQAVMHYPYDPSKVAQLMSAAGFIKGSDGVWNSPDPAFGRMSFETNVLASPDSDNEMHIMADTWRKLGFDVKEVDWPPSQGRDREFRNAFPGLSTTSTPPGENALTEYRSDRIPTAANRWNGTNRGAWAGTPAYDRLVDTWETSLVKDERTQAVIQMNRILNDDCVVINLYWKLAAQAFARGVTGPRITSLDGSADWNIHEWEYR
ncbi:MAG TPA: ABC transporter substrate-binding protein [Chloroflexota bacterium]|nr:ABC transporter substrate-binding protein [Chloroflexota bacterium]